LFGKMLHARIKFLADALPRSAARGKRDQTDTLTSGVKKKRAVPPNPVSNICSAALRNFSRDSSFLI
jgi:hypothetical protein